MIIAKSFLTAMEFDWTLAGKPAGSDA